MVNAVRRIQYARIVMLVSIAVCALAGEISARTSARNPANTLFHALSFISISIVGATAVVRRTLVLPSEALLKERSDDGVALARWQTGYLLLYALCEAMGLFGLVLRMDGFPLASVWGFYLGGFLLLLLFSPPPALKEIR
jgi:hypothetical protein